jgi:hypothetical protein
VCTGFSGEIPWKTRGWKREREREVLTGVATKSTVFWDVTPYRTDVSEAEECCASRKTELFTTKGQARSPAVLRVAVAWSPRMHGELVTPRSQPQITAAVLPPYTDKGEVEALLHDETEPLLRHDRHQQQGSAYYHNVPEVAIHFNTPSSVPGPQFESHNWQPNLKKEQQKVEGANGFGIFLAVLSGAFFTLSSAGVKGLKGVDPMELLVVRSLLQVAAMLPIALSNGEHILGPKGQRGLLQLQVGITMSLATDLCALRTSGRSSRSSCTVTHATHAIADFYSSSCVT